LLAETVRDMAVCDDRGVCMLWSSKRVIANPIALATILLGDTLCGFLKPKNGNRTLLPYQAWRPGMER
jgi:hypothetical protein